MPDKPTGKYGLRVKGKRFSAEHYHLFADCATIKGSMSRVETDRAAGYNAGDMEVFQVSDELIDMLTLHVCKLCEDRSTRKKPIEIVSETLGVLFDWTPSECGEASELILKALEEADYRIVIPNGLRKRGRNGR